MNVSKNILVLEDDGDVGLLASSVLCLKQGEGAYLGTISGNRNVSENVRQIVSNTTLYNSKGVMNGQLQTRAAFL